MLIGFLVVAGLQLALVVVPALLLLELLPGDVALRLGLPLCIATGGVMGYATRRALRTRRTAPAGVPVARDDAPRLWDLVDAAAAAAGVRPPGSVTVVADAAVTVGEHARLLGLIGGPRHLHLGLPLLQVWDGDRIRAAVAHELAHASPRLSRWAPVAYRGRVAAGRTVPRISRRNPAGPLLRAYAAAYRRVDAPVSRAQELAADRIAAGVAGAAATAAVLRDRPALEAMQRIFYAEYVGPGWRTGHVPDDVFGGFLRMLAARAEDMAALRSREPARPGEWDTHPPLADRLAALAAAPAPTAATASDPAEAARSAAAGPVVGGSAGGGPGGGGELVPDLPGLGRALQAVAFPPQGRTVVGWDEFFGAARAAEMEREADAALGTLTRAAGSPVAHAGDVLDLAADGRLRKVAEAVFPELPADETAGRVAELITLLLALAALRSRAARWRHSWTGTAELVAPDGSHLDLGGLAALVADPATVDAARERLARLGIDPSATAGGRGGPVSRAEVVGGVVNLVVDGSRTDLLIVDTGLLLVPGLPRSQNGSAKRRLARYAAADLRADEATGSRFVPYADVTGATQTRRAPRSWDFRLRDGGTLTLRAAWDSDELPGGWAALEDAVAFVTRTR
jgi:Zn-dependent protease with chaperone function